MDTIAALYIESDCASGEGSHRKLKSYFKIYFETQQKSTLALAERYSDLGTRQKNVILG